MLKTTFILRIFALCLFCVDAQAANIYCRPAASGDGSGSSWANAKSMASVNTGSGINAGDTVWIAGGSYSGLTPNKTGSSGSQYYYRRARSDSPECNTSAGWSPSFDSTIVLTGGISFDNDDNYCVVSGRTTATGGSYGIKIDRSASRSGAGITADGHHCTVEYVEAQGAGYVTVSGDMRGVDSTPSGARATGNKFSHIWFHDWESALYFVNADSPVIEYCIIEDIMTVNWPQYHPNGIITWGCPNGIFRYSTMRKGPHGYGCGEGMFFEQSGGSTGWQIYGNTFEHLNQSGWKAVEVTSQVGPMNVYNNTFIDCLSPLYTSNSPGNSGGNWKNNLYYQCSVSGIGTMANNLTATASDFISASGNDFRLTVTATARNGGAALSTDGFINVDRLGVQRGADGAWDVGAYEYAGGGLQRLATPAWMRRTTQ